MTRSEEELCAWLTFANLQYTPRLANLLLKAFGGDPGAVLAAGDAELEAIAGFASRHLVRLRDPAHAPTARQIAWVERYGVSLVTIQEAAYPAPLQTIPDPPPLLFVRGALSPADTTSIGIVGSRHATPYGRATSERMAHELAEQGVVVVSGGAVGIDAAAHRGALLVPGGRTIAFLGCGLDVDYPRENGALFAQIVENGALVSEFPLGAQPESWRFPARNRLISGLSLGTLVVEAPKTSGALITARYAVDHGRVVMAVPGNIDRPSSEGTNALLKEGMTPVTESGDILRAVGLVAVPARAEHQGSLDFAPEPNIAPAAPKRSRSETSEQLYAKPGAKSVSKSGVSSAASQQSPVSHSASAAGTILNSLSETKQRLVTCLNQTPRHIDSIAQEVGLSVSQTGVELTLLELEGLVRRLPGNTYIITF